MNFDIYYPFVNKEGKKCPGIKAVPMDWQQIMQLTSTPAIKETVQKVRNGDKEAKKDLPAICWVGRTTSGKRLAQDCEPTQFVMVDIDHVQNFETSIQHLIDDIFKRNELKDCILCVHATPSLGIRIVFRAIEDYPSLIEHMRWMDSQLNLSQYGEFDTAVKDLSRISFLVPNLDFYYINNRIINGEIQFETNPINSDVFQGDMPETTTNKPKQSEQELFGKNETEFSEEEVQRFEALDYRGIPVKIIVAKYVEVMGEPSTGEIHNYYNEMVKNFRCITSNDKRALLYLLPRFGHTSDECWSQIVSITRVNTLSRLPSPFYYFLKDNGFYTPRGRENDSIRNYMMSEEPATDSSKMPPYLPPVFRELISCAPEDFIEPAINALLPIMGTLTSYLQAIYPFDGREHTTSFFSVIYAPPGTGKGFVERFMDMLFEDLRLRDYIQSERENVYLRAMNRKGDNDKAPDAPHTSLRIIPPKNSEAEFLQKQRDNHGYHMFTYAAEMDSWAKGVRAAGGNKDDMVRIAWDNGLYGQQFKAVNTFKGQVRLYWNVLITGTIAQLESYFKNVENGLVTRCSFTSIDNQEFVEPPVWKSINKKGMAVIKKFMERCDRRTYTEPCNINIFDLETINDDDFDKEVDWRFNFRERQTVDMEWIMPTLRKFQKEQIAQAALDVDRARDVFRRRVGVRGFRLALMCYGLWETPRESDLKKCIPFIEWWMNKDITNMLKLWGAKYNEQAEENPVTVQRTVFDSLGKEFTKSDVFNVCIKQGIKTPVRRIIYEWSKMGYIEKLDKEHYKKR